MCLLEGVGVTGVSIWSLRFSILDEGEGKSEVKQER